MAFCLVNSFFDHSYSKASKSMSPGTSIVGPWSCYTSNWGRLWAVIIGVAGGPHRRRFTPSERLLRRISFRHLAKKNVKQLLMWDRINSELQAGTVNMKRNRGDFWSRVKCIKSVKQQTAEKYTSSCNPLNHKIM